ncbi:MAG TPA: hypothetical protein VK524_09680 [Polyangiaceae bacterium]|nr:hypothetical protein [Polyangiaceae bacterium]
MRSLVVRTLFVALAVPSIVACGESNESTNEGENALPEGCSRSGYDGDGNCIAAPEPGKGIQLHAGPINYDDEAEVRPFLIQPGEEKVECYTMESPNDADFTYLEQQNRMRPGSHHMIIRLVDPATPLGWGGCAGIIAARGGIPGSQTQVRDIPGKEIAPENEGLGRTLPAKSKVQFEFHFVNNQRGNDTPMLREAWVNLLYKDPAKITEPIRTVALIGGLSMDVPARSQQTIYHSCQVTKDARIVDLFGHFHANTERFTAWRHRADQTELLYESYNWAEPADLLYDSVNENPAPEAQVGRDGGYTGQLSVQAGDVLEWECHVNNKLDHNLRFANEAYTADMCILFGGYVGPQDAGLFCARNVSVR